ncbi:hypothetical protein R1sor_007762 [Riccia sorocarpa]|uniref:Uncharacterized protein n=1 Tax=Riccia sorocarpa TaxID=122646 RepID=A0ABD3HT55_9MARC
MFLPRAGPNPAPRAAKDLEPLVIHNSSRMSGPGITPKNTQETQGSEGSQGVRREPLVNANLISAMGGRANMQNLMDMFEILNRNAMEEIMGGISKLIDDKLVAAVANSQQSAAGMPATREFASARDTAIGTSHGEEVSYKLRPKLALDIYHEPEGTECMNEFNVVTRNVYERNLKVWEKWVDQPTDKKDRMVLEIRSHFFFW